MDNKIIFVKDRFQTQRGVELNDGRVISLFDEDNKFYLRFDYILDLENGTYKAREYSPTPVCDENEVNLNNLIKQGKAKEVQCYDQCEYFEDVYPDQFIYSPAKIRKIRDYFVEKGYNVTIDAIKHNLLAWMDDYKSGYRDEENGYHLFTPCGCNPLSIRLSTLSPLCEFWQITYDV
jgi:hypothetical protein